MLDSSRDDSKHQPTLEIDFQPGLINWLASKNSLTEKIHNFLKLKSDEDKLYIKFIEPEGIYKIEIDDFFIWNRLGF